jgi:hypothetical protein
VDQIKIHAGYFASGKISKANRGKKFRKRNNGNFMKKDAGGLLQPLIGKNMNLLAVISGNPLRQLGGKALCPSDKAIFGNHYSYFIDFRWHRNCVKKIRLFIGKEKQSVGYFRYLGVSNKADLLNAKR